MRDRAHVGEVRAEGRSIRGTVIRYGELSPSHRERFSVGSLQRSGDVWLDLAHDPERVVCWEGAGLTFAETRDALTLRAEVPRTVPGDLALSGVRDGSRAGLSVEFEATRERREPQTGVRIVEAARLFGVGLVKAPSYPGSRVEARQRTADVLSGDVKLGGNLSCQCRGPDCDYVNFAPDAFDDALSEVERGDREVPAFLSGQFGKPVGRAGDRLTIRVEGDQLRVRLEGLPELDPDVRAMVESLVQGSLYQFRPYIGERASEIVKVGRVARVEKADLRGVEIAPISGPTEGLQPLTLRQRPEARERRRRVWL